MTSHGGTRASGQAAFADTWASASQSAATPIPDLLRGMEAIVVAVIGHGGELKDANRGFLLLMTRSSTTPSLRTSVTYSFPLGSRISPLGEPIRLKERYIVVSSASAVGLSTKVTSLRGAVYGYEQSSCWSQSTNRRR